MFHIVYKTINKVNNKYYYGVHTTDNIDDGYLGSGTNLMRAIAKYGRDSFEREIICLFDDRTEALLYEKKLVSPRVLKDVKCYNIVEGGGNPPSRKGKVSPSTLLKGEQRSEKQKEASRKHSEKMKGRRAHNRLPTTLFGIEFQTLTEGLKYYGLSPSQYYYMKEHPDMVFNTAEDLKQHTWEARNKKISEKRRRKEIQGLLGYSRVSSNRNKF